MLNDGFELWIANHSGNKYVALQALMEQAKKLVVQYDYVLLDSEAISWVLTGERPKILDEYERIQTQKQYRKYADVSDFVSDVDDKAVRDSVIASIQATRKARHLIYLYKQQLTAGQQARVRILTRMFWYR